MIFVHNQFIDTNPREKDLYDQKLSEEKTTYLNVIKANQLNGAVSEWTST